MELRLKSYILLTPLLFTSFNCFAGNTNLPNSLIFKSLPSYTQKIYMYVTLYGSPDNDPPGTGDIAHPVIHKKAGGIGTYQNPITYAVKRGYLPIGQKIYVPYLRKYFIMEDDCVGCTRYQVDLWAGYGTAPGIIRCEYALTKNNTPVFINPRSDYPVDTTPIWNEKTKTCQKPYNV